MKRLALQVLVILCVILIPVSNDAQDFETGHKFVYNEGIVFLQATEMGFPNMEKVKAAGGSRAYACLLAKSAAEGRAKGKIAETLEGFHVAGGQTVIDIMNTSEKVAIAYTTHLKGVTIKSSDCDFSMNDPVGKATAEIALTGNYNFLGEIYKSSPNLIERAPAPSTLTEAVSASEKEEPKEIENYDGLILDASDLPVKPDLNIVVKSEKGIVAYSVKSLDPLVRLNDLMAGYVESEEYGRTLLKEKGSSDPLVIKPLSVEKNSEFIVSSDDALKIISLHEKTEALKQARVMILTG